MKKSFSWESFEKKPIVGIIRGIDKSKVMEIMSVYHQAGLSTIEITMNTPNVISIINQIAVEYPDMNIGVGTVCSIDHLDQVLDTAAQFIVTPIVDTKVIEKAKANKLVVFTGAYTPTEIYKAWNHGADVVKVFPASQLGVRYVKDVLAPLDHIRLLPTGGVNIDNLTEYLTAGAIGVGMGSSLFPKKLLTPFDKESLLAHFEQVIQALKP